MASNAGDGFSARALIGILLFLLSISVLAPGSAFAGNEPFSMDVAARWGGPVNDVQVVGNIAYIGSGSRLVALNVADPNNIIEIGSIDLRMPVIDFTIRDQFAYVCTVKSSWRSCQYSYGFCTVDISNPANMKFGSFDQDLMGNLRQRDVQVYGDVAFVINDNIELNAFDVSDPYNISSIGEFFPSTVPPFDCRLFKIAGDLMYVVSENGQMLRIFNLQPDPMHPTFLGEVVFPVPTTVNQMCSIDVSEGRVAVTGNVTGAPDSQDQVLMLFDVSAPSRPVALSAYTQFGVGDSVVTDVAFAGDHLLLTDCAILTEPIQWQQARGLVILNIKDPTDPFEVTSIKTHGAVRGVRAVGNRAYVMDDGEGMIIFDITNPANPQRRDNYHSPATMRDIAKVGNLLYVVDRWNGFTILDVSNPQATPQLVGVYQTPNLPAGLNQRIDQRAIAVHNNHAYLATGPFGIHAVNVSNPASPQLVSTIPNPVFEISGFIGPRPTLVRAISMTGNVAHVSYRFTCPPGLNCPLPPFWVFRNYDISDPERIELLGSTLIPGGGTNIDAALRMAIDSDGIAFVAREVSGGTASTFQVLDTGATNRPPFSNPSLLYTGLPHSCTGVALNGSTLLLASESIWDLMADPGLYLLNVDRPTNPQLLSHLAPTTPGVFLSRSWDVVAQNDRAYVLGRGRPNPSCPILGSFVLAVDVKNPSAPLTLDYVEVSTEGGGDDRGDLLVDEPYVFAAGGATTETNAYLTSDGLSVIQINGIPTQGPPADLNGDGFVNGIDLGILLSQWFAPGNADLNGDRSVNGIDLGILLASWTV